MATSLRRIKRPFAPHPAYQQVFIISRLFYSNHATPLCGEFSTVHEKNSSPSKEKKQDTAISALEYDRFQPYSANQKNLLSGHKIFVKNNTHGKHKSLCNEKQSSHVKRCGKIMTSMLHKTYWNMRDRQLIDNSNTAINARSPLPHTDLIDLEKTFYPPRKRGSGDIKRRHVFFSLHQEVQQKRENFSAKQLFFQQMHQKYQDPNEKEATALAQCYPNPMRIFEHVVHPLMEAKGLCVPKPSVTSHLKQIYWKAALPLPWTQCLIATHPNKEAAIHNIYLRACEQLETLGLMLRGEEDEWQPLTSERVVTMLDTLAKYIESSFVASKGRGFKIILSQVKPDILCDQNSNSTCNGQEYQNNITNVLSSIHLQKVSDCKNRLGSLETERIALSVKRAENSKSKYDDRSCHASSKTAVASSEVSNNSTLNAYKNYESMSNLQEECSQDTLVMPHLERVKAKWECTVHVGWPFPFTVQAQGVSLPGAQMLGYMEVATKLKTQGLLTRCNSALNSQVLGRLMLLDLQTHWENSINSYLTDTLKQKFAADAELFCDASISGFGAYLVLQDTGKVRWLCETWQDHDTAFLDIVHPSRWMFESTLAEIYATVTSVYSWKKKLRGKRLLCFTDSQTTVGLINSFMANPVKEQHCIHTLDQLVQSLQATCLAYSITLQAVWVDRERNTLADLLSRKDTTKFFNTVPRAAVHKTKAKKLSIPWAQYK